MFHRTKKHSTLCSIMDNFYLMNISCYCTSGTGFIHYYGVFSHMMHFSFAFFHLGWCWESCAREGDGGRVACSDLRSCEDLGRDPRGVSVWVYLSKHLVNLLQMRIYFELSSIQQSGTINVSCSKAPKHCLTFDTLETLFDAWVLFLLWSDLLFVTDSDQISPVDIMG